MSSFVPKVSSQATPLPKGETDYSLAWPAYGGGFLPREETPSTGCGCWFDLEDGFFKLRGANYLADNVKKVRMFRTTKSS